MERQDISLDLETFTLGHRQEQTDPGNTWIKFFIYLGLYTGGRSGEKGGALHTHSLTYGSFILNSQNKHGLSKSYWENPNQTNTKEKGFPLSHPQ